MIQTGQGKLNEAFFQNEAGEWTLRTGASGAGGPSPGFDVPSNVVSISKSRSGLVDTFNFYSDLAQTTLVKTVTITYTSNARIEFTAEVTTP